jgi:hypothetical protein
MWKLGIENSETLTKCHTNPLKKIGFFFETIMERVKVKISYTLSNPKAQ